MNKIKATQRLISGLVFALMMSVFAATTWATTLTWNGSVGGSWDTVTSNWLDGANPTTWSNTNPDSAVFGSTGAGTINVAATITATGLTFNASGYTLTNSALTLSSGAVITANAAATINNSLAGTGGMVKAGTGTLTLGGNNTFSGGATLSDGTVFLKNAGALNSGTPNAITLGASGAVNPSLVVTNMGVTLGAVTVPANVTGAVISATQNNGTYSSTINGATLGSPLTIKQSLSSSPNWYQWTWNSKISGAGGGSGNDTLVFNNTSSMQNYFTTAAGVVHAFTGNVHLVSGLIAVQNGSANGNQTIPDASMLWIESGEWRWNTGGVVETIDGLRGAGLMGNPGNVTLTINASNSNNDGKRVFSGTMGTMAGTFTKSGAGAQTLSGAGITYGNATAVTGGTLSLSNTTAFASAVTVTSPGVLDLDGTWTVNKAVSGTGSLTKSGAGTVTLAASQTYTGNTTVNAGTLRMQLGGSTTPYSILGMTFWVDATDPNGNGTTPTNNAPITTWVNKASGGVANLTVTGPNSGAPTYTATNAAFNSKPTIKFSATGRQLGNSYNFGNTISVIYVGRIGATKQRLVSGNNTVNWILGYWSGNMNANYWNGGSLGTAADTNPHIWINGATAGANMKGYRYDAGGEAALGDGTGGAGPTSGLLLGGGWSSNTELSDGDIAELLVYNRQLTTAERTLVETYLYNKWFNSSASIIPSPDGSIASPVSVAANATFGGYGIAGNITVASGGTLEGGNAGSGTLTATNVTLGATSTDTATIKGTLSATSGYKALSVTNLTINGGDQSIILDVAGTGLTSGNYYDLVVSANPITAPNASSVLAALKSNARVYTPALANGGKTIQIYYDEAASVYWTGAASTAWNITATNWKLSGNDADTQFMANDVVFFKDSPIRSTVDISNGNVTPASTVFSNTTLTAYTLQGANGIASGFITKNGNGLVTISNANTTASAVALNDGTLSLAQVGGLGTGSLNFNGGTLEYTGAAGSWSRPVNVATNGGTIKVASGTSLTSGGSLTGAGTLTKSGSGTLVLPYTSGAFTTPINIDDGMLTLNYGGGNPTYAGQITGSNGILRLEGTGVSRDIGLTLTANNSFTGETHIYGRRIFLNSPTNAIGGDIVTKVTSWPWHDLTLLANEQIADTAVLRFEHGSGGDNVYEFRLNGKTETVAGISNRDDSPAIIENAGYDNDGGNDNNMPPGTLNVSGSGRYIFKTCIRNQNNGSNNGSLSFGKSGTGTQELWNADIYYTGLTTVSDGLLVLQDTTAFNSSGIVMNGGTLELKRTSGSWSYSKAITAGTGAGNLVKSGAGFVTLSGANTYTGTTTVNAGTLLLQEAPNFASSEIILSAGTFELSRTNGLWTYNNAISAGTNVGHFVKSGAGTAVLGGANTYAGTTTVNGGTLLINGSNSGSGACSVASGATFGGVGSIGGTATFNTGAKAVFTVTLDPVTKTNTTPMTIAGVMTFNATEVHVNAPENLPPGKYRLATSGALPSGTVTATPVLDSGSYGHDFSSAAVYIDTVNKALILSVNPRNTIISFF